MDPEGTAPPKIAYVVACTHTGSTLLTRILNQHPQIFSAGELQYLDRYWHPTGRPCSCGVHALECPVWREVFWQWKRATKLDLVPVSRVSAERGLEWIRALTGRYGTRGKNPFPQANSELMSAIAQVTGATVVLDNSKSVWRLLPLVRAYPERVFVLHLVRSPEGHVASRMRRKGRGFLDAVITKYLRTNLLAERLFGRSPHYLKVRYEDLVARPEETIRGVTDWLGLPVADPFAGEIRASHDINGNDETKSSLAATLKPDPSRLGKPMEWTGFQRAVLRLARALVFDR